MQSALDSFLNAFHQQNVSNTQNIVNTRMLTAQEQQLRLMSAFTETMQQTMQQMQAVTENMPYRIHKIAEEYFKPMKTVLDESVQAMREEQAAQQKTAWHFNQLTGQMGDLCGKLTATGEQYSEVTDKLSEVSTSLSSSVQSMEGFMTEIQQANNNISQNSQVMIEQIVSQCKAIGEQSQVTKNLVESSESLAVASVNLAAEMDQQITNHKELLASIEKLTEKLESNTTSTYNTLHEHLSQIVCQLNGAVSKLEEQYTPLRQEMQEGLTESFRIYGSEIRQLIEQFSAVLQRMEHISDDIPNHYRDAVRQFIEEKDREMQRLLAQNVSQEQQTDRDHSSEETEAAAETVEEDAADAVFEIADGVIE